MKIYWIDKEDIPGRLGITARPRGNEWLEQEIMTIKKQNIGIVVSLLESEEIYELGLEQEEKICNSYGIAYINFPIKDRDIPRDEYKLKNLIMLLNEKLNSGVSIVIHCRMGIGRSSIIAACILQERGLNAEDIFRLISKTRGLEVPDTDAQIRWVEHRKTK